MNFWMLFLHWCLIYRKRSMCFLRFIVFWWSIWNLRIGIVEKYVWILAMLCWLSIMKLLLVFIILSRNWNMTKSNMWDNLSITMRLCTSRLMGKKLLRNLWSNIQRLRKINRELSRIKELLKVLLLYQIK